MPYADHGIRDVLEAAHGDPGPLFDSIRIGPDGFDPLEIPAGSKIRVSWGPPSEEDFAPPSEEELGEGAALAGNVDRIAWYVPYVYSSLNWGIYFDPVVFPKVAAALWFECSHGSSSAPSYGAVEQALYRVVLEHELFHARVELAAAHWHLATRARPSDAPPYVASRYDRTLRDDEEALATAVEMISTAKPRIVSPADWPLIRRTWQAFPQPHPYDRWPDAYANWDTYAGRLSAALMGGTDPQLFRALPRPLVPVSWWVPSSLPVGALAGLMRGATANVDFAQVNRVLSKDRLQREYQYGVKAASAGTRRSGGGHPKASQFERHDRSYKTTVKPERKPFRYFDQLARLFGFAADEASSKDPEMKFRAKEVVAREL